MCARMCYPGVKTDPSKELRMLHLVEIMTADDEETPYPVLSYVVDIAALDAQAHQQLQYRLDALLLDAPFENVEDLYTTVSPIEMIESDADQDALANNIVQAALAALERDGVIFKQEV
jgi:hypothetical protein